MVVINRALARRYFPDEDPIGKTFGDTQLSPDSLKEIVGIVDDIREGPLDDEIWPAVYYPFNQDPDNFFCWSSGPRSPKLPVLPMLRAAIRKVDPDLGMFDETTMAGRIADSPSAYLRRSSAWLIGAFAASPCCSAWSASTASSRTPSASAPARSASAWRWERTDAPSMC